MQIINVHPFPARMASDVALSKTDDLPDDAVVLDPMAGSGTVLQAAAQRGLRCTGLDVDPLAVLISKVATRSLDADRFAVLIDRMLESAGRKGLRTEELPWFDKETAEFAKYWFAPKQRAALRRIAYVLQASPSLRDDSAEANAVRLAVSRLIITKDRGASLARDVSHSRPHRVALENDFDVFTEILRAAERIKSRLSEARYKTCPTVRQGDARRLQWIRNSSVDMILTSPPYLNAIDYMRGHRLSLIWLGYGLSELGSIRSGSVGAERGPDVALTPTQVAAVRAAFGNVQKLPRRLQSIVGRYSLDLLALMSQSARVLKREGKAVFVIGNSRLKDVSISNARGLEAAAKLVGLSLVDETTRKLPAANRYLPIPADRNSALGGRMRTETVMTFAVKKKSTSRSRASGSL